MKKLLVACLVLGATVGLNACSTQGLKTQTGTVKIEVAKSDLVQVDEQNLADLYQVMDEGLLDSAKPAYETMKSEFLDGQLVDCQSDAQCQSVAYEAHFDQLHQYIYKNDFII